MAGKKKSPDGWMSVREYAKSVGVSHVAVLAAIKQGKITDECWNGEYFFDIKKADEEYGDLIRLKNEVMRGAQDDKRGVLRDAQNDKGDTQNDKGGGLTPRSPLRGRGDDKGGKSGPEVLRFAQEDKRFAQEDKGGAQDDKIPDIRRELIEKFGYMGGEWKDEGGKEKEKGVKWKGGPVPVDLDYKEALRVNEILRAEERRLANDVTEGLLVRKAEINKQLQAAGIEVRKVFERMPLRVVDAVRGANTRSEGLMALEDAVSEALTMAAQVIEELIGKKS